MALRLSAVLSQQHPILALVGLLFSFLAAQLISRIVYNLFFNPLSRFPGPKFAAVSYIPQFLRRGKGDIKYIEALHDQYGSVVRIAPDELSFTGARAWKGECPGVRAVQEKLVLTWSRYIRVETRAEATPKTDRRRLPRYAVIDVASIM